MRKTRQQLRERCNTSMAVMVVTLLATWLTVPFGVIQLTSFFATVSIVYGARAGYAYHKLQTFKF